MAMWVYSSESMPSETLTCKPGYSPEIMQHAGINIVVRKGEWQELPTYYPMLRHRDWMDKRGQVERIYAEEVVRGLRNRFEERGVIFLDHAPTDAEKLELAKASYELNLKFRTRQVDWYEEQVREKEVTGHGRTKPTPYENECYEILGLNKPYSVEAFKAQRQPGHEAAERIATAIADALKRDREQLLTTKVGGAHAEKAATSGKPAPAQP